MSDLIIRNFNGHTIRHRADGFMSLTDMCKATGKLFGNWYQLKATQDYLQAFSDKHYCDHNIKAQQGLQPSGDPLGRYWDHNNGSQQGLQPVPPEDKLKGIIEVNQGGLPDMQGTWGERRVAMRLAQWLDPMFALQVDEWVVDLMTTGTVTIAAPAKPEPKQLPQTTLREWADVIDRLGLATDPIVMSAYSQRLAEELTGNRMLPGSAKQVTILTSRATTLGYSESSFGNGAGLGRFVIANGHTPIGKTPHGRYQVNTFEVTDELDRTIGLYCGLANGLTTLL